MKILVISDSHSSSLSSINFKKYDVVIHCGDYGESLQCIIDNDVLFVKGNCDTYGKEKLLKTIFNKKILVTHGNLEGVKYDNQRLVYRALEDQVDICFYGHTHEQSCFIKSGILFINPGSFPQNYIEIDEQKIKFYRYGKTIIKEFKW